MSEFLYRPILAGLTDSVRESGMDPYDAYAVFRRQSNELPRHTYASTSITSGGHARNDQLVMGEVIARNTASALAMAEQLAVDRQVVPAGTIEPVMLGKTGWSQSEYMEFWLLSIAGAQVDARSPSAEASTLRQKIRGALEVEAVRTDIMDSHASAGVRAPEYFRMATTVGSVVRSGAIAVQPVAQVVRMIDPDTSLGVQAERVFARSVGVPVMDIRVVQSVDPSKLANVNSSLHRDVAALIGFGAAVFNTRTGDVSLQLVEEQAA